MSVIANVPEGWILCHQRFSFSGFQLKKQLFEIRTPFLMDSAANRMASDSTEGSGIKRIRKRHKKRYSSTEEPKSKKDEEILQAFQTLRCVAADLKYFDNKPITTEDWLENNRISRTFALQLDPGESHLLQLSEKISKSSERSHRTLRSGSENFDLTTFGLIQSDCPEDITIRLQGEKYLIPGKSSFILGDVIQAVESLAILKKKYDLILLDPPWQNKSVKRKRSYSMMDTKCLQDLLIPEIAETDCLVVLWATNNSEQTSFVTDVLFPAWSVSYLTTWHWIKVTQKGEPVTSFQNDHKKPYEKLILGRFQSPASEKEPYDSILVTQKVFLSVPSIIHSHKPPLTEILYPLLKKAEPSCLELFARYLLPNWTSCGNEVLKLQQMKYFDTR